MKKEWRIFSKKADYEEIAESFGIDKVTAGIIVNRGCSTDSEISKFLKGGLSELYDEGLLPDMEKAAELIISSIKEHKSIRIAGDYDIDGVCSVYILLRGLQFAVKMLGIRETEKPEKNAAGMDSAAMGRGEGLSLAGAVDYVIPDRVKDGYGINTSIVENAVSDKKDVIITCDNGISAIEELKLAKESGLTVIVTDHHEVRKDEAGGDILPPADAVVDPKRSDSVYPNPGICGAVVAWKLIKTVFEKLFFDVKADALSAFGDENASAPLNAGGNVPAYLAVDRDASAALNKRRGACAVKVPGISEAAEDLLYNELLPFAAVATIGDVMELSDENRIIVKEGLGRINSGLFANRGFKKLREGCSLSDKEISAYHIGFIIGPCINAGGRLETAELALKLFLSDNDKAAGELSERLVELNEERKEMTEKGVKAAISLAENEFADDKVLTLYVEGLHESLAGIVAGRVREKFGKPVFVVTDSGEGLKGSGRSIEAYSMFERLCEVSDLLTKYGGHPMAAGFSLEKEKLSEFRRRLNENSGLKDEDFIETGRIDFLMPLSYISYRLINDMEKLKPFGNGNERPIFAWRDISIRDMRVLGKNKNVLKLRLTDKEGYALSGVMFGDACELKEKISEKLSYKGSVNIVYYPEINIFNGIKSLQITVLDVI